MCHSLPILVPHCVFPRLVYVDIYLPSTCPLALWNFWLKSWIDWVMSRVFVFYGRRLMHDQKVLYGDYYGIHLENDPDYSAALLQANAHHAPLLRQLFPSGEMFQPLARFLLRVSCTDRIFQSMLHLNFSHFIPCFPMQSRASIIHLH